MNTECRIVIILNILVVLSYVIILSRSVFIVLLLAGLAVPSLPTRVAFMSVVASARTRSIYHYFPCHRHSNNHHRNNFGGQAILSSVECYDPETDKWTKLVHMKKVDTHICKIQLAIISCKFYVAKCPPNYNKTPEICNEIL